MALTRTPSLAIQLIKVSSVAESQILPSFVRMLPFASFSGTPLWCSATTCQNRLNTGDPDDPELVSVIYQRKSPTSLMSLLSRTQTCLVWPAGCWIMVRYSPRSALPGSPLSGSQPQSDRFRPPACDTAATAT